MRISLPFNCFEVRTSQLNLQPILGNRDKDEATNQFCSMRGSGLGGGEQVAPLRSCKVRRKASMKVRVAIQGQGGVKSPRRPQKPAVFSFPIEPLTCGAKRRVPVSSRTCTRAWRKAPHVRGTHHKQPCLGRPPISYIDNMFLY